jgi:hypothetical protein
MPALLTSFRMPQVYEGPSGSPLEASLSGSGKNW